MSSMKISENQQQNLPNHELDIQKEAYEQQSMHLTKAHYQALVTQIGKRQDRKLHAEDALLYLQLVKMEIGSLPVYYNEFLDIMKQCRSEHFDAMTVIARISQLFEGYPVLRSGFGMFLPPSYHLLLQLNENASFESALEQVACLLPESDKEAVDNVSENETTGQDPSTSTSHASQSSGLFKRKASLTRLMTKPDTSILTSHTSQSSDSRKRKSSFTRIATKKDTSILTSHTSQSSDSRKRKSSFTRIATKKNPSTSTSHTSQSSDLFKKNLPSTSLPTKPVHSKSALGTSQITRSFKRKSSENLAINVDSKVPKITDSSIASVSKYGSLKELMFFEKVKRALGYAEVYNNFLRCLMLYNDDVVTRTEIVQVAVSFLGKFPELLKEFKDILGLAESGVNFESVPYKIATRKKIDPELAMDIDYSTGRRNGTSYRALPKSFEQPKCSGRTPLCKEILNDTWVSFPSWSEDSTFISSCKTQYEELIYHIEDERFEFDMVLECNASTIQVLDNLQKRISKMTQEERSGFTLDDTLGGTSTVLQQKALNRIYGDKSNEVVEGLKRNPIIAVPIVLKRLRLKEEEWKGLHKQFNATWREQNNTYYLKSLDHQGINFKQNDSKYLRSKNLLNEIETLYEEKKQQIEERSAGGFPSPHLVLQFKDLHVFEDATNLILQHVKRQSGIYKEDRKRIEHLLHNFIQDFFGVLCGGVNNIDSEHGDVELEVNNESGTSGESSSTGNRFISTDSKESDQGERSPGKGQQLSCAQRKKRQFGKENCHSIDKLSTSCLLQTNLPYRIFITNSFWYIFFRQFYAFIDRLAILFHQSLKSNLKTDAFQNLERSKNDESLDVCDVESEPKSSYSKLLDKISQLLTGSLESTAFEEDARNLFGIHGYLSFTMDKVIHSIVRQLHQISSDETSKRCTAYHIQHVQKIVSTGCTSPWELLDVETEYQKKVERMIGDDNCYKIIWYQENHALTIELLDPESEVIIEPSVVEKWSDYVDNYLNENTISCEAAYHKDVLIFLPRNLRRQQKLWKEILKNKPCQQPKFSSLYFGQKLLFSHSRNKNNIKIKNSASSMQAKNDPQTNQSQKQLSPHDFEYLFSKSADLEEKEKNDKCEFTKSTDILSDNNWKSRSETKILLDDTYVPGKETIDAEINLSKANFQTDALQETIFPNKTYDDLIFYSKASEDMNFTLDMDIDSVGCNEEIGELISSPIDSILTRQNLKVDNCGSETIDMLDDESRRFYVTEENDNISCDDVISKNRSIDDVEENVRNQDFIIPIEADSILPMNLESASNFCPLLRDGILPDFERHLETMPGIQVCSFETQKKSKKVVPESRKITCEIINMDVTNFPNSKANFGRKAESSFCSETSHIGNIDSEISDLLPQTVLVENSRNIETIVSETNSASDPELVDDNNVELNEENVYSETISSNVDCIIPEHSINDFQQGYATSLSHDPNEKFGNTSFYKKKSDNILEENNTQSIYSSSECNSVELDFVDDSQLSELEECYQLAINSMNIHENTQCKFFGSSYKMHYVANLGSYMYRRGSLVKSKKNHQKVSAVLSQKFNVWHRIWLERYVTPSMLKSCNDWLLRSDPDKFRLDCITMNDFRKPPYTPYTKYRVRYYKIYV